MKIKLALSICVLILYFFLSCKKEKSCEGCINHNRPPIANAGPDTVITLPTDSVLLDGSASSDPDGTISKWLWTKIDGPASATFLNSATSKTIVRNLKKGSYQFVLRVTDNGGLSATDTMRVVVDSIGAPPPPPTNHPPIAHAGQDQTIYLPVNTAILDGTSSTDPDNNITSYQWTKISGPSSFNITNTNVVQPQVTNLVQGVYLFELKVTDAGGLFSKDTVVITIAPDPPPSVECAPLNRPTINAQLVQVGSLSTTRSSMATATAGDKILFAGGRSNTEWASSRVDIFDVSNNSWSIAELSIPRFGIGAIGAGTKIFFAGGMTEGGVYGLMVSRVDIYDVTTGTWTTAELSAPREDIATGVLGNKVFFAGGDYYGVYGNMVSNVVDIYDLSTNTWSTATLSQARTNFTATSIDNKVYFAGGYTYIDGFTSNVIDIYDGQTGSWSTSSLTTHKAYHAAIAVQNKIYWASGDTLIDLANEIAAHCVVEIRDINTQAVSYANLFQSEVFYESGAYERNGQIVFFPTHWDNTGTNKFDILDPSNNTWSIGVLNCSAAGVEAISKNNIIYVAGGAINGILSNQVWKLEF